MQLVFISNFYNYHQAALSEALFNCADVEFVFIETQPMSQQRLNMGWSDSDKPSFVKQTFLSEESKQECMKLINSADVVIIGSASIRMILPRLKKGGLTFRYSERLFKKGKTPKLLALLIWNHMLYKRYSQYMLCASAYTSCDFSPYGLYKNRCFKWGYFPKVKEYAIYELIEKKHAKTIPIILWCGRLIDWKHPEIAVQLAEYLKERGYNFKMEIIGSGEMDSIIRSDISEKKLTDCVYMLGSMSPEMVRNHMEDADIYIGTSDFQEGWGVVINEALNSGCAVVASHAMGSVPYLIKHKKNGLIYQNGNNQDLFEKVEGLLGSSDDRKKMGLNAYNTMFKLWNAENAAERFVQLCNKLLGRSNDNDELENGPCSIAYDIKESEMYNYLMGGR